MALILDEHDNIFWSKTAWFSFDLLPEKEKNAVIRKLSLLDKPSTRLHSIQELRRLEKQGNGISYFELKINPKKRLILVFNAKTKTFTIVDIINVEALKLFMRGLGDHT